jgi:hypothetical protein
VEPKHRTCKGEPALTQTALAQTELHQLARKLLKRCGLKERINPRSCSTPSSLLALSQSLAARKRIARYRRSTGDDILIAKIFQ